MNKQAKQLWIEALRSGEYKQGLGNLNLKDNYCCLGVLCEVYLKNCDNPKISKRIDRSGLARYGERVALLPPEVEDWADLKDRGYFSYLNDRAHQSFAQIADYIERYC